MSKSSTKRYWLPPLPREGGNAIVIALVVTAIVAASAVSIGENLTNTNRASVLEQRRSSSQTANISSLALFAKLLAPAGSGLPVIYPEPYISASHQLTQLVPSTSPVWSFSANSLQVYTPVATGFSASDLAALYGNAQPKAVNPATDQATTVALLAADPSTDPVNLPYLIPSVVATATTTFASQQFQNASRDVVTTARIAIPPPPPPSCTLTSSAGTSPVTNGSAVTFTAFGTGVVASGYITDGVATIANFPSPTAANSVKSANVQLGTMTSTMTTSQTVGTQTVTAYVTGPQGTQTQCTATVQINPTPAGCGPDGLTQVKLLTPFLQNNTAGNYLEYSVYTTDCQGNFVPFSASAISFSYAASEASSKTLTYTATGAGTSISGTLVSVIGHDLFGDYGSDYYHRETNQPMSFSSSAKTVLLHIDMGGQQETPYADANVDGDPSHLDTMLQFGNAAPVDQVVGLQ